METILITVKYFSSIENAVSLEGHCETARLSPGMEKSQYSRIRYEHSEYILI